MITNVKDDFIKYLENRSPTSKRARETLMHINKNRTLSMYIMEDVSIGIVKSGMPISKVAESSINRYLKRIRKVKEVIYI